MTRFTATRLVAAALLFVVLVAIALFAHDKLIRGALGDVLVVVFLYELVRAIFKTPPRITAASVFAFACAVELSQALDLITLLGLQQSRIARTIIGSHADWLDIAAYAAGALIALGVDHAAPPAIVRREETQTEH